MSRVAVEVALEVMTAESFRLDVSAIRNRARLCPRRGRRAIASPHGRMVARSSRRCRSGARTGQPMTTSIVSIDDLNEVLAASPILQTYEISVTACASGECSIIVPFVPALVRMGGIVSGMTLMGAADVAMWLAIMTYRGSVERWVTS